MQQGNNCIKETRSHGEVAFDARIIRNRNYSNPSYRYIFSVRISEIEWIE